jgi:4-hydroxy-tetrahydrodipicolinate reductase
MLFLVLGRGKTGSLVAQVAKERGHGVRVVGEEENRNASALTAPVLAGFDAVIDFTTPEAAVQNMRACLATGARMVVGTTGWYQHLDDMKALCARRGAALLYSTNFSIGVQALFKVARELAVAAPGYRFSIRETHHAGKRTRLRERRCRCSGFSRRRFRALRLRLSRSGKGKWRGFTRSRRGQTTIV